ncbi:hypothetical protein FBU31_002723 [Coemansia sp. 'formosensis']|nr:hypothetical protein FBU31_002723 [Coemansia sp. 'formosensis']
MLMSDAQFNAFFEEKLQQWWSTRQNLPHGTAGRATREEAGGPAEGSGSRGGGASWTATGVARESDHDVDTDDDYEDVDEQIEFDTDELNTIIDGCGEKGPTWASLRALYPPAKSKFRYFAFTGPIIRDIAQAKLANIDTDLGHDEAYSQLGNLGAYAIGVLANRADSRSREKAIRILQSLVACALGARNKLQAGLQKRMGKAIEPYQAVLDISAAAPDHADDGFDAEMHTLYVKLQNNAKLASIMATKAKPTSDKPKEGFRKRGGHKQGFANRKGGNGNQKWSGHKHQSEKQSEKQPAKQ